MKREYIVFKVYAECPLLKGWLRLGNDAGIFELVEKKENADFSYTQKFSNEENAREVYDIIRKELINYVYSQLFAKCETIEDYEWLEKQVFFGQFIPELVMDSIIICKLL